MKSTTFSLPCVVCKKKDLQTISCRVYNKLKREVESKLACVSCIQNGEPVRAVLVYPEDFTEYFKSQKLCPRCIKPPQESICGCDVCSMSSSGRV